MVDIMASMPELVTNRLTFAVVMSIFDTLIGEPSGLMREALILAALKSVEAEADHALLVEVRPNDAYAADIAILRGAFLQELFLVTPRAELPATMAVRASRLLEDEDLPRVHVLTDHGVEPTQAEHRLAMSMTSGGTNGYQDISVLDIRHEIASATGRLHRRSRRASLHKLDQYLRIYADPVLADEYVLSLYDTRPDIVREPAGV